MIAQRYVIIFFFMAAVMLQGCNSSIPQSYQETSLRMAASTGDIVTLKMLLKQGIDPNATPEISPGIKKAAPLITAASNGHLEAVKLLVASSAKIDQPDSSGCTALDWAVRQNHYSVIKYLFEHGASAQCSKNDKFFISNALMYNTAILKLLLEHGIDPNLSDRNNMRSILYEAVSLGQTDAVRILIEAGANPNVITIKGKTPLQVAQSARYDEIARLLRNAGALQ